MIRYSLPNIKHYFGLAEEARYNLRLNDKFCSKLGNVGKKLVPDRNTIQLGTKEKYSKCLFEFLQLYPWAKILTLVVSTYV